MCKNYECDNMARSPVSKDKIVDALNELLRGSMGRGVLCRVVNFEFTGWVKIQNLQHDVKNWVDACKMPDHGRKSIFKN